MQPAWINGLDNLNLLAAVEILDDLMKELNIAVGDDPVTIHMWNQVIRYRELHPGDSPGIRDAYMERRFKIMKFLQSQGVIKGFEVIEGSHRWQNLIGVNADRQTVSDALDRAFEEYLRRQPKSPALGAQSKSTPPIIDKAHWSRSDKIGFATLVICVIAAIGTYLAVPGFQDWVKGFLSHTPVANKTEVAAPAPAPATPKQ